ncbi:MAG TPA: transposase [Thermoguttaceae bacterium]|nr:transposase [Thermoguttaceae bacterium]
MQITDHKSGKPCFRKRRKRYDEPGHARELTFSCYGRYHFLDRDRTRLWFVEALQHARKRWPVDLWAWVIMPEHVHLLVYPRQPNLEIGRFQATLKEEVARKAIAWLEGNARQWLPRITVREGKRLRRRFWQPGGGYDRNVVEPTTVHSMVEYIHANPVRRGLVARPEDWEWSSARWYAGLEPVHVQMDRTIPACPG